MRASLWFACVAALLGCQIGLGQTPAVLDKAEKYLAEKRAKEMPKLEDALTQALKNNPEILLKDARVREAEAELSKTRLEVLQKVVIVYQQIRVAEAAVEEAQSRFARIKALNEKKVIAREEFEAASIVLQKH